MFCQAYVFRTKEDYLNENPEVYTSYESNTNVGMRDIIIFEKAGKKVKIDGAELWGFTDEEGMFYRIFKLPNYKKEGEPLLMIREGSYCIFIQGGVSQKGDKSKYFYEGIFYSKTKDGELYNSFKAMQKDNPDITLNEKCGFNLDCALDFFDEHN
jgi:hypothetical protein